MREFPQELVDQVIDDVAAITDTRYIALCGRVCSRYTRIRGLGGCLTRAHSIFRALAKDRFRNWTLADADEAYCTSPKSASSYEALSSASIRHLHRANRFPCGDTVTQFELFLGSDTPLHVVVAYISSLPLLTCLRVWGGCLRGFGDETYGLVESAAYPAPALFLQNLHTLDISVAKGTDLFFAVLLSPQHPPTLSTLSIGGYSITSLSLGIWIEGGPPTREFEDHALASTPALKTLLLARQFPRVLLTTPTMLSSVNLTSLTMELRPCPIQWSSIDRLFASAQFRQLQRVSFVDWVTRENIITPEAKLLMPQSMARNILVTSIPREK
ncbi:hypothetical protein B0H16DRAFT_1858213 [Mycena metata]|uniref:Uncharacterized protein n=1 Tax=Mycena metata TaxID=1033252 RepID=A0AAD7IJ28_9AGAR|nr:hypothetical protein B0H16DRAFT_1858213 [Mycena metata]